MLRTPDDCTAVVRVMQDFEKIAAPHQINDPKGRLNFDETPSPDIGDKGSRFYKTDKDPSGIGNFQFSLSRKRAAEREKDVELFCAKGRISHLENETSLLKTETKRAKIEQQKVLEARQGELRRETEKNGELQQQLKYVVDQEKNAREELKMTRKEFEEYKKKSEEKVHSLQRQKLKLTSETEEVGFLTSFTHTTLRNLLWPVIANQLHILVANIAITMLYWLATLPLCQ